jgi:Carbohydrate-selective porin, OprB family/S-layer homology domain
MMNIRLASLLVSPAVLGAIVLGATSAKAEMTSVDTLTQVSQYNQEGKSAQSAVTSVSQLSDVKPTDWAFQALQSLVERYGCIAGYPDKTYRGNRAMTRYEFAAGLNACMDRVNDLISASTADMVKKEDLATLRKLQEQFAAELATLRGRVDALEAKTATLEKQQFSTTTKLAGEVIFAVTQEFSRNAGNQVAFQDRVRLSLNTSFTGKDLLVTRLAAGNSALFSSAAGAPDSLTTGLQASQFGGRGGNSVSVDWLAYYASLSDKLKVYIPAAGGLHYDYAPTMSPALDTGDSGNSTLSVFGQRNPIYSIGGGAGLGVNYDIGGGLQLSGGYMAGNANNPTAGNGLFNGDNSFLAQISYAPTKAPFQIGFTYVNAYKKSGAIFDGNGGSAGQIGTPLANNLSNPVKVDAYGISGSYQFNPGLVVNAFGTYAKADNLGGGTRDLYTYGLGVALPDFGKKGNLLGFVVGAQPYQSGTGLNTPLHVEGFYKYQLNDRLSITPGVIWVTNPTQVSGENSALIGTVRTTFTF